MISWRNMASSQRIAAVLCHPRILRIFNPLCVWFCDDEERNRGHRLRSPQHP
jgi:DUF1365 family protein